MDYLSNEFKKQKHKSSVVLNTTIPLLKSLGIKKLDYLILTHGDADHMGESINLINNFHVSNVLINEGNKNHLEKEIIKNYPNYEIAKKDYFFNLGDFSMLSINNDLGEENDSSLVFFVTIHNYKILFMGDASIKSEENILNNYKIEKVDILKVGHHGSRTSSSDIFIKMIKPNVALISAGVNNKFNHPHYDVLERLNRYNIKYFVTKDKGTITINFNNNAIYFDKSQKVK